MSERLPTNRWRGVRAVALLAGAVGILAGQPLVLLSAVVGVAFAAHANRAVSPDAELSIQREVSDESPDLGQSIGVTLTVRNDGEQTLGDLRIVDGVPEALAVTEGSPRLGTALRPGKQARLTYTIEARRGEHAFAPVQVIARDLSGAVEVETSQEVDTTLTCVPTLSATTTLPLRGQTSAFTGRVETDTGGSGVEFHAIREYRRGDALSRIDWKRRARTGELTTLLFREERAATVVLLIDARSAAYRAPEPTAPHAVDRSVTAAGETFAGLVDGGDQVGIAAIGGQDCWLAPGAGREHRARATNLLATHSALSPVPPENSSYASLQVRRLRKRLPANAQVVLCSSLCDDYARDLARRIEAHGHAVTVISPDVTADSTPGQRLARVERRLRITALREAGLRVIDWNPDQPLSVAIQHAREQWSG